MLINLARSMLSVGSYEFSSSDLLGHGAFALVYKGNKKGYVDQLVAIKKIRKSSFSSLLSKELKEISILSGLIHENIVRMHDFLETPSDIFLVLEFCNMGDLNEFLNKFHKLSEDCIRYIFKQIGMAITFLHRLKIIHRDLKPQNILLNSNDSFSFVSPISSLIPDKKIIAKIGDFGFARVLTDTTMATTLCGSPLYMAPEILLGKNYDSKVDMWSIGTIIYQCFTGFAPFIAKTPQLLRRQYETDQKLQPKLPPEASPDLNSLFLSLLKKDPRLRLGYSEFCSHPFFYESLLLPNSISTHVAMPTSCNSKYSSDAVQIFPDSCSYVPENNLQPCDRNFMFASPKVYTASTDQYSITPPSNFVASPSSHVCNPLEMNPTSTGFVLLPTVISNSSRSDDIFLSSLPRNLESDDVSSDTQWFSKEEIPFLSLVPNSSQMNDRNYNPTSCEDIVHFSACVPLLAKDQCFRIHDVSPIFTPILANDPKNNLLSVHDDTFITTNSSEVIPGSSIATMFVQRENIGSVNHFNMLNALPPLQSLQCPYESFCKTLPNHDRKSLILDRNIDSISTDISSMGFPFIDNNCLEIQLNRFCDNVIPNDIDYYISNRETLHSSIPGIESNLRDQIENCLKLSKYIVYMIGLLGCPSLSLTNFAPDFSSLKSNVYSILTKLVLLVKLVKCMFMIVKRVSLIHSQFALIDRSLLCPYFASFAQLLEFCKNDIHQNKEIYIESAKRLEAYYSCIPSAETLLYYEIVDICQDAILEHVFNQSFDKLQPRFVNIFLLSNEISKLCDEEVILSITPFTKYPNAISVNQICIQ